jgi:hypothetical protein
MEALVYNFHSKYGQSYGTKQQNKTKQNKSIVNYMALSNMGFGWTFMYVKNLYKKYHSSAWIIREDKFNARELRTYEWFEEWAFCIFTAPENGAVGKETLIRFLQRSHHRRQYQGCEIFRGTIDQNEENKPNDHKI